MKNSYLIRLEQAFEQHQSEGDAEAMQQYMKDKFEFYGIKRPLRDQLQKSFLQPDQLPPLSLLKPIVWECWEHPKREFQYFAMDLLNKYKGCMTEDFLPFFEKLITTKSWWDTVDGLASWSVGSIFSRYSECIPATVEEWLGSENMWLQRTCLLYQLKYKDATDIELLEGVILFLKDSKEFFIQKAIGWVLREYSKTNALWVREFIANTTLPALSVREGMKALARN